MGNNDWIVYLEKMRLLEKSVKLTAFHTLECVRATEEVCYHAKEVVDNIGIYLNKRRRERQSD